MLIKNDKYVNFDQRVHEIAYGLRDAITPIIAEVAGRGATPTVLARRLSIDRTLSQRVMRVVRSNDPYEIIHKSPAPPGLLLFLKAAQHAKLNQKLWEPVAAAVAGFEELIHSFPDGRNDLETAIADRVPSLKERGERTARQGIYKSMSYVFGYKADVSLLTRCLCPSPDGENLDSLMLAGRFGVRCVKSGPPIVFHGSKLRRVRGSDQDDDLPYVESLYGERRFEPTDCIVKEYSTASVEDFAVVSCGESMQLVLERDKLPLGTCADVVMSWMVRHVAPRYRTASDREWYEGAFLRMPSKMWLLDWLVHKDVLQGVQPELRSRVLTPLSYEKNREHPFFEIDQVDLSMSLETLGDIDPYGTKLRISEVPRYASMLESVLGRVGFKLDEFRVCRLRTRYPIPLIETTIWYDLPERPREA